MPGERGRGRRVAAPVQHIDLVPTLLDWLGIARRRRFADGRCGRCSRAAAPPAATSASTPSRSTGAITSAGASCTALTDARYRFIKAPRPELYDLQTRSGPSAQPRRRSAAGRSPPRAPKSTVCCRARSRGPRPGVEGRPRAAAGARLRRHAGAGLARQPGRLAARSEGQGGHAREVPAGDHALGRAPTTISRSPLLREVARRQSDDEGRVAAAWRGARARRDGCPKRSTPSSNWSRPTRPTPTASSAWAACSSRSAAWTRRRRTRRWRLSKAPATDRRARRRRPASCWSRWRWPRRTTPAARRAAALAQQADPAFPLPAFVEGVILHDSRAFDQALPQFQEAAAQSPGALVRDPRAVLLPGRHAREPRARGGGDSRVPPGAAAVPDERPGAGRAWRCSTGPAAATPRPSARSTTMLRVVPTPDGYAMAAKTWTIFGEPARAEAVARRQAAVRQVAREAARRRAEVRVARLASGDRQERETRGTAASRAASRRPRRRRRRLALRGASRDGRVGARCAALVVLAALPARGSSFGRARRRSSPERPIRTSCSSRSTRCAPTRSAATAGAAATPNLDRARRRSASASTSRTRTPSSRCRRTRASSPGGTRSSTASTTTPASACRRRCRTLATLLKPHGIRDRRLHRRRSRSTRASASTPASTCTTSATASRARLSGFTCPSGRADASSPPRRAWIGRPEGAVVRVGARVRSARALSRRRRRSTGSTPTQPYYGEVAFTDFGAGAAARRGARPVRRAPRSSSSPAITARGWAITASRRTACSPTNRRCGFR